MVAGAGTPPVEVIDDIHTPLGLLWDGDVLYVSSAETVEAFASLDGTTFTSRTTIVSLPDGVGEVNGLTMSSDGRLVLGISAPCDACVPTSELSGAVVSFRPDGSDLRVEASSIRAPIGLAYYPGTDDLFVTMNHQDELGAATPGDWLALVESGQDWGFPDCYGQGGDVCNGVPEPVAELDQHAAVSGITFVTGQLGDAVGDAALVAEWTTGKVMRVTLSSDGSTYASAVGPFVTGLQNPVPVITTPDGAVLIGDWGTGTIYRIAT
jgi:glucose/arabinose dehydrogenase